MTPPVGVRSVRVAIAMTSMLSLLLTALLTIAVPAITAPSAEAASATTTCDDPRAGAPITSPRLASYTPITPRRVLDTRNGIGGIRGELAAGCTIKLSLGSDVPADAQVVALSLTSESGVSDFMTVYPCALGRPESSNLNYRAYIPTANLVMAMPDVNRQVCIYSHGATQVIVDVNGWWSGGPDRFASVEPQRIYDSRRPGFFPLFPGQPREIVVPTSVVPADATSVAINLTTTNSTDRGYFTAYPCGTAIPNASNLNFAAGEDRAVAAIVGLAPGQRICVVSSVLSNVVVDVNGYYSPAPQFGPTAALQSTSGVRIVDTRNGIGGPKQPFGPFEIREYDPVAGQPAAAEAAAVTLNVISSGAQDFGFVTIYPCGGAVPNVSSLNYRPGEIASNLATIELSSSRTICVQATTPTDIIIDVYGTAAAPPGSLAERISFVQEVFPPFDAVATDYAVKCPTASTAIGFGMDLLPGVTASVDGAAAGSGLYTRTKQTDGLLTLRLQRGSTQRTYHFRCLPPDFPDLKVERPGRPSPGWYLTAPYGQTGGPYEPFAIIFDEYGAPVWYKRLPRGSVDFKRLADGTLALIPASTPFGVDDETGYWNFGTNGVTIQRLQTSNTTALPVDHHELLTPSASSRVMLSYPTTNCAPSPGQAPSPGNCTADFTGITPIYNGPPAGAYGVERYADGAIEEIGGDGFFWRASDHIPPTESTLPVTFTAVPALAPFVDAYHINAVDRTVDGDYLVTARHLDGVFLVDGDSEEIVWALGGDKNTPGRFCGEGSEVEDKCLQIAGDPRGGPKRPHDGRLNGNVLTMMDNRTDTGQPSRAVAYQVSGNTATFLWHIEQSAGTTGPTLGSVRVGADGAILVGWPEPIQYMYQEFDANRKLLMSIGNPGPLLFSYRIVKEPKSVFDDVDLLRSQASSVALSPPP